MSYRQKSISRSRKWIIPVAAAALLIGVTVATLELTNTTHLFGSKPIDPIASKTPTYGGASSGSDKGESAAPARDQSQSPGTADQPGDNKNTPATDSSVRLVQPSGAFVSNHRPNFDGDPAPNTMSSVCTTSAGASCTTVFTNGTTERRLPAQTTDRSGSAFWDWNLRDVGVTVGTWKIKTIVTLGTQSETADDGQNLVVSE